MAGFHLTNRAELQLEEVEPRIKITIPNPEKLRTLGDLIHFDNVSYRYRNASKLTLGGVTFTVGQGGRCAFVGGVSLLLLDPFLETF
jgi:ABC-type multidrug transport system fused ATPase/permease subunit